MSNYAIDDGEGNRLTAGLQEHNAQSVAQRMADERGESVYLYETGEDEADAEPVEIQPRYDTPEREERGA
jgi:hypothetical protein